MDESALVRGVERVGDLRTDRERPFAFEWRLCQQQRLEVASVDEPHRQVQPAVGLAGVVDRDDVRVLERGGQLGLSEEACPEAIVLRQLGGHELERERALQAHVVRPVDDAHAAPADQPLDPVLEDLPADRQLTRHVQLLPAPRGRL